VYCPPFETGEEAPIINKPVPSPVLDEKWEKQIENDPSQGGSF